MHHLPSLFSFFAVPNRFTSRKMHALEKNKIIFSLKFQIVSTIVRRHNAPFTVLVFKGFSAVPNRFKYRQDACFRDIFLQFQIVSNTVTAHALETLFYFLSLQFQIVSTIGRRQNAPFTVIVFKIFSAVPNRFKYRQDACFRDIFFFSSLQFQII